MTDLIRQIPELSQILHKNILQDQPQNKHKLNPSVTEKKITPLLIRYSVQVTTQYKFNPAELKWVLIPVGAEEFLRIIENERYGKKTVKNE